MKPKKRKTSYKTYQVATPKDNTRVATTKVIPTAPPSDVVSRTLNRNKIKRAAELTSAAIQSKPTPAQRYAKFLKNRGK